MTSSTKPEVDNVSASCKATRGGPCHGHLGKQAQQKLVKFRSVIREICVCEQTDRHTDTLITILGTPLEVKGSVDDS